MKFTDIFIRRPVLALGREPGDPGGGTALVQLPAGARLSEDGERRRHHHDRLSGRGPGRHRRLHHDADRTAVAQANGIDYMTSTSQKQHQHDHGVSAPELRYVESGRRNQHQGQLGPEPAAEPERCSRRSRSESARPPTRCTSAFTAATLAANQITDYLTRVVQPKLQAVRACRPPRSSAARHFPLRAWLDPKKLAAYGLTASDVSSGPGQQRLHFRRRQYQGSDGSGDSDLDHQPAFTRANFAIWSSSR